jgi:type II secretory pathway pseudopilin PulG
VSGSERGIALLEVLVAVMILGITGVSFLELVTAGTRAVGVARERERVMADEERLMAAYTLLSHSDLDRRLGQRQVGPYLVRVQRPERSLYRIALGIKGTATQEDLVTVVFRPEPSSAP